MQCGKYIPACFTPSHSKLCMRTTQKCFEWNERARETGEIIQLSSAIADDDKDDDDDDVALERPKIL